MSTRVLLRSLRAIMEAPMGAPMRLHQVTAAYCKHLDTKISLVYRLDSDDKLAVIACAGEPASKENFSSFLAADYFARVIADSAESLALADMLSYAGEELFLDHKSVKYPSMMGVPVLRAGIVLGAIILLCPRRLFNDEELEATLTSATLVAEMMVAHKFEALIMGLAKPITTAPTPVGFGWTPEGKIKAVPGVHNLPSFQNKNNKEDHKAWMEISKTLAVRLINYIVCDRPNIRDSYVEALREYVGDLPVEFGQGNFMLADSDARSLRNLFKYDADSLPPLFASKLRTFLEHHIALRNFYPEVSRFYFAVRHASLKSPLPQDAVDDVFEVIEDHTPTIFTPEVSVSLRKFENPDHIAEIDRSEIAESKNPTLGPPPDPLGEMDPQAAKNLFTASAINSLYSVFLKGKDLSDAVQGWGVLAGRLSDSVEPVLNWLKAFLS